MMIHPSVSATEHRPTRARGCSQLALWLLCCASATCNASEGQAGFSGAAQVRGEHWNNFLFAPAADDTFGVARVLLGYRAQVAPTWAVFGQIKLANATSRDLPGGRRTVDVDTVDLQQGYLEWRPGAGPLRVRAGRMSLRYGRQRLVSPLPWGNTLRAWDGVHVTAKAGDWDIDSFWTYVVPVDRYDFNTLDGDLPFGGVYAQREFAPLRTRLDLYLLTTRRPVASFNGTQGSERRDTYGAHIRLATAGIDFDIEGAWQSGHVGPGSIEAAMLTLEAQRTLGDTGMTVTAGLDYASGDDDSGGDVGTFQPPFPLGHAYFGFIDAIGRQNLLSGFASFAVPLRGQRRLTATAHRFRRATTGDAIYNAGGGVVRQAADTNSRDIGSEIDLTLTAPVAKGTLLLGLSRFFRGAALKQPGSENSTFGYVQWAATF